MSYASGGSTACPNSNSISIRSGHSLPGVQSTYVRYEAASDQFVGRTVCGLPILDAMFATLPPHFPKSKRTGAVDVAIDTCFPAAPKTMKPILEFCLASLVYHEPFLRSTLKPSHKLFSTALFTTPAILESLGPLVFCGLPKPNEGLTASGIPPFTSQLGYMDRLQKEVSDMRTKLEVMLPAIIQNNDELVARFTSSVVGVLEERAIAANTVTRHGLQELLAKSLADAGVPELVQRTRQVLLTGGQQSPQVAPPPVHAPRPSMQMHMWGGKLHRVPENFTLPAGSVLVAWQHWVCGNASEGYPPFHLLTGDDMPTKDIRKDLSHLRCLMNPIENKVKELGRWIENPTPADANRMFEVGSDTIKLDINRKRRFATLSWTTHIKLLRLEKRQRAQSAPAPAESAQ